MLRKSALAPKRRHADEARSVRARTKQHGQAVLFVQHPSLREVSD
jgi:hypothetical protein